VSGLTVAADYFSGTRFLSLLVLSTVFSIDAGADPTGQSGSGGVRIAVALISESA